MSFWDWSILNDEHVWVISSLKFAEYSYSIPEPNLAEYEKFIILVSKQYKFSSHLSLYERILIWGEQLPDGRYQIGCDLPSFNDSQVEVVDNWSDVLKYIDENGAYFLYYDWIVSMGRLPHNGNLPEWPIRLVDDPRVFDLFEIPKQKTERTDIELEQAGQFGELSNQMLRSRFQLQEKQHRQQLEQQLAQISQRIELYHQFDQLRRKKAATGLNLSQQQEYQRLKTEFYQAMQWSQLSEQQQQQQRQIEEQSMLCPICYSSVTEPKQLEVQNVDSSHCNALLLSVTPCCAQFFHHCCLFEWFELHNQPRNRCPICKRVTVDWLDWTQIAVNVPSQTRQQIKQEIIDKNRSS